MSTLFLDFETRSAVDIKKCGADVYARDPSTEILCAGWAIDDGPVSIWTPGSSFFPETDLVVAHNASFELAIWNHVGVKKYGWAPLDPARVHCTMAMAYSLALPGALADAAPAAGLSIQKDSAGHRVMMQLSQPREIKDDGTIVWWEDFDKFLTLCDYCATDVEVERQLYKRLIKLSEKERKVWILDQKINQRGVQIDMKAAEAAISLVEMEKERLDTEMKKVTKNRVGTCTATGQLTDWLKSKGVECEGVAKSDVVDLLSLDTLPSDVRRALLLRQEAAKSSTAKLESMRRGACSDGRVRGLFQYHGAGQTGRFAGRRIQPQNFPRPKLSQDQIDEVFELLKELS